MKVSLATVHATPAFTPLALMYLKAALLESKCVRAEDVRLLEFTEADSVDDIARRVLEDEPDVVGLSCYVWNVGTLLAVSARIKEAQPEMLIVLGGPEVGPVARPVLEGNPTVDCIVRGEGEVPFAEIVAARIDGLDLAKIKGISLHRGTQIIETEAAPIVQDLNLLASPTAMADLEGRIVCLETQRGCVFRCHFCFYNKDLSIRNRRFHLDRVKREILHCLRLDVREVYLMDPVFNLHAARAKAICRFIAEHNSRRIPFHTEVWAEFIDEELARLMQEANFRFLEVGLQTTDDAVLATVERRLRMARFLEGIGHLKRFDIPFEVQLIHGLPGETAASFRRSLDFAASLQAPRLAVFPLMVLPGTQLRRNAELLGIAYDPLPPYTVRSHRSMDEAEIAYGARLSDAVEQIGNAWTIRLLAREAGITFSDVIEAWLAWSQANASAGSASEKERIRAFVAHFCQLKRIPPQFYERSAEVEFGERAARAAQPAALRA